MIGVVAEALRNRNFIYLIGNGGSAATCIHFANDLMSSGCRAMSLVDPANITRIANDDDYSRVFENQLKVLFGFNDVLVAISASGNSGNIIKAVEYVRSLGGLTVGIVGFDGGVLKNLCTHVIHTPTNIGDYEKAEDEHLRVCHQIAKVLRNEILY